MSREELIDRDWWVGLDGWVLQDGNYTDFAVGQVRQFALEFGYQRHERLKPTTRPGVTCQAVDENALYRVNADLIRAADAPMQDGFVLDFGLLAYKEWMVLDDLRPPRAGLRLSGEIYLSVDHFAYMDQLATREGIPPMIYTWRIEEIRLDTSPGIQVEYGHPLYVGPDEGAMTIRDPHRREWRNLRSTDMWGDEGSYTLRCTLLEPTGQQSMARSGRSSPYGPSA
ncbi:hypothetical protein [Nocardioides panacisoli]|uniref:Uncharacterized protein n=1 Tax=Nocardioides panacisoli TaxID=627624 RepID=A0ABP7ITG3_9ACTN